jgi:hypothetical protein
MAGALRSARDLLERDTAWVMTARDNFEAAAARLAERSRQL